MEGEVETHTPVKIELLDCYSSNFTFVSLALLTLSNIVQSILSSVAFTTPVQRSYSYSALIIQLVLPVHVTKLLLLTLNLLNRNVFAPLAVKFNLSCVFLSGGTSILSFIISTSATALVILVAFFLLFYVARTNPADPFLQTHRSSQEFLWNMLESSLSEPSIQPSLSTMHQGTSGFDHHCPWANTCIGKSNYKPFFTFQVMILLQFLFSAGTCIYNVLYEWVQHLPSAALSFFRNQQILLSMMDIVMIVIDIAGLYIIRRETTFLCILRQKAETEEKKKKSKELKFKREEERKRAKVGAK
ncbi:hypothetical protein BLNAU_12194 [Blattamonas nauphoetae]|uniref:Palmitoyltransferase n=1 Tax=Blattamonas nauphoetae TaxID=2049346 RepID=A0ABQ9XKB7_9EUKA|nr:hypothetical protein BLNAU_12194 [Blattamonas nauphoetae]